MGARGAGNAGDSSRPAMLAPSHKARLAVQSQGLFTHDTDARAGIHPVA
jgi:hypothetical protein